jgi:hypothetical protein
VAAALRKDPRYTLQVGIDTEAAVAVGAGAAVSSGSFMGSD